MGAKSAIRPATILYDEDFVAWTAETARLLRAGRFNQVDIAHLAEEIEDRGKSDQRELESRLTVLILHLLKWQFQPEKRSGRWQSTIIAQRAEVLKLLEQSPSMRRRLPKSVGEIYSTAVRQAAAETGFPVNAFPRECSCSVEQILDQDFLPGR